MDWTFDRMTSVIFVSNSSNTANILPSQKKKFSSDNLSYTFWCFDTDLKMSENTIAHFQTID